MEFTLQELIDVHDAIKEAQDEQSKVGPQSEAYWERLEALRMRFSNQRVKQENPDRCP